MSRWRAIASALVLVALAATAGILYLGSGQSSTYTVDVVFDDARGLVPGQLVQIAGADVGTIDAVSVTSDFKARIHMEVEERFGPFRENATCTIKSKGLIAENYVQCDPGTPDSRELTARGDRPPTVPVERTTQPVSLVDLFEIWNAPTRQRGQILLSSLGIALAGRGEDVNAILRRANPSLTLARDTIDLLERQRDDLASTVEASDEIVAQIARRPEELQRLTQRGARVATETAEHREALGAGVRRLPPLLDEAVPALHKLDATMAAGRPLLDQLTVAAPDVNRLTTDVPELADAARPTLRRLKPVLRDGAATARRSRPMLRLLRGYAAESLPSARTAGVMFPTLERRGFVTDLLSFFYNMAVATARYDENGHILPAHVGLSRCTLYATAPREECKAGEATPASRGRSARRRTEPGGRKRRASRSPAPSRPSPAPAAPPGDARSPSQSPALPPLPENAPAEPEPPIDPLLDFLLR